MSAAAFQKALEEANARVVTLSKQVKEQQQKNRSARRDCDSNGKKRTTTILLIILGLVVGIVLTAFWYYA